MDHNHYDLGFDPGFRQELRAVKYENQAAIDAAAADYERQLKSYNYRRNKIRRRLALLSATVGIALAQRLDVPEPKERSWREFL